MRLIILGIQGSGKGTQAAYLAADYGLLHLSAGDLLRAAGEKDTPQGKKIKKLLDEGKLVPQEIIHDIFKTHFKKNNFILDGYPRDIEQAKILDATTTIDHAVYILLNEATVYQRLLNRTQCPKCHEPYGPGKPEQRRDYCDHCAAKLIKRTDDNKTAIKQRIMTFKQETMPVIQHYKKKRLLITINGNQPPHQVYHDLINKLGLKPKKKILE
ncbi:MAG: nucleoside monophosphate kinase [Nanoarchaeota archaeon]|nr:nucleoside monophosphate kinase [Nanoarchaeota archaeon]